jgi:hypothetical protein
MRVRRRVRVRVLAPEQRVPRVPTYQVQLVPRPSERLAKAHEGLGDL